MPTELTVDQMKEAMAEGTRRFLHERWAKLTVDPMKEAMAEGMRRFLYQRWENPVRPVLADIVQFAIRDGVERATATHLAKMRATGEYD